MAEETREPIPKRDVHQIWMRTTEMNWRGLRDALDRHRDTAYGVEEDVYRILIRTTAALAAQDHPFPGSPDELYAVLNAHAET